MDFLNKTYYEFYLMAGRTDEKLRKYVLYPVSNLFGKLAIGG